MKFSSFLVLPPISCVCLQGIDFEVKADTTEFLNISGIFFLCKNCKHFFHREKLYSGQMFPFREIQTAAKIFIENIKRDLIDDMREYWMTFCFPFFLPLSHDWHKLNLVKMWQSFNYSCDKSAVKLFGWGCHSRRYLIAVIVFVTGKICKKFF